MARKHIKTTDKWGKIVITYNNKLSLLYGKNLQLNVRKIHTPKEGKKDKGVH